MQWWCSAQQGAWSWTWTAYPGVWLFLALLVVGYVAIEKRGTGSEGDETRLKRRRRGYFVAAILCLWTALDWPLGPLGAGYLLSLHMLQYVLIGLIAPALMLLSVPGPAFASLGRRPSLYGIIDSITQPVAAFFIFNTAVSVLHWPSVTDGLMRTQLGSFALDLAWLVTGLIFWWPLISPVPDRPRFNHLFKIAYLGLNIVLIRPPVARMLYGRFPAYATYELAPPIAGTNPLDDQQLAAAVMKVGSAWVMVIAISFVFLGWYRATKNEPRAVRPAP